MKISPRQQSLINRVLREELNERSSVRKSITSYRRSSLLNEAEVYGNMHPDDLAGGVSMVLDQDIVNAGQDLRTEFDKKLFKELSRLVAQAGGEKVSGTTLLDDLEDFDADGLMELQTEFSAAIVAALEKYMSQIALLVTHAKLSGVE